MQKGGLYFFTAKPHQKHYVDTAKRNLQRCECGTAASTINGQHSSAADNEVRLDISAGGFWQAGQMAFLDIRGLNPNAKRYANIELSKAYEINEKEKKKTYNESILQVEHGSFTPLVISATGGMSRECKKFCSRLAEMICKKTKTNYNVTITWIRRKTAFSLIKSIGICRRGSLPVFQNDNLEMPLSGDAYTSDFQSSM